MRNQIEKNMEILFEEIEKLSNQKMTGEVASKLSVYRGAYKALCMAGEDPVGTLEYSEYRQSKQHSGGKAHYQASSRSIAEEEYAPFSRSIAMEWTRDMENSDGTRGPHWNMEQVQQVMEQRGIDCDPVEFFAVLNSIYSDYCAVAKKHGVNKMDFYADLAKAWLEDKDAVEDKAGKYFTYIVRH